MKRVLLSSVYRPFCVDAPFDCATSHVQHDSCHRQFTREQGVFSIRQQCSHLALHVIAANLEAETLVLEYPSVEELEQELQTAVDAGRPYDYLGISCVASYVRKARHMCEIAERISPSTRTVIGGSGALAIGEVIEPFGDHVCRAEGVAFFRGLLGQDPAAPIDHPPVPSVHRPNTILGCEANPWSFSLAVTLGCHRGCAFCSTSAQFGRRRVPVLGSAEEIFGAMQRVEQELRTAGHRPPYVYYVIFDENFLADEPLARAFLRINRQQLATGTPYLPFLFADAASLRHYTPEELLQMGVDAVWVGMESTDEVRFSKNEGADFHELVDTLQSHGIKVFVSFIAGLESQTRSSIEADIEHALGLGAVGFQYSIACPMPGTPWWSEVRDEGTLDLDRPERINMDHYYLRHPELDEAWLRAKTDEFHRRDYERNGPLVLRFMKLRLSGLRRHRGSGDPALAARARGFANDLMDACGALSAGPVFAPSERIASEMRRVLQEVRSELGLRQVVRDAIAGRASLASVAQLAAFTTPGLEPLARRVVVARALRADPRSQERCASLLGLALNGARCAREVGRGRMEPGQPVCVRTRYPRRGDPGPQLSARGLWAEARRRVRTLRRVRARLGR